MDNPYFYLLMCGTFHFPFGCALANGDAHLSIITDTLMLLPTFCFQRTSESFHSQSRVVSSVSRMVCSGGGRGPAYLEVCIDGVMWTRIRFFQVSSQWQTHVKLFPICLPPSAHSIQTIAAGASAR